MFSVAVINIFFNSRKMMWVDFVRHEKKINKLKRWTDKWVVLRKQVTEIKRWLYSPLLSSSNNLHWLAKVKILRFNYTFVRLEKFRKRIQSCSLTQNKNGFLGLNLHEFPLFTIIVRRKEPQGSPSVINFYNKHSIVKLFI